MLTLRWWSACLLLLPALAHGAAVLENPLWRVEVEPATLALRVQPAGAAAVAVSDGVGKHAVGVLQQSATRLQWQWNAGAYRFELELKERDLWVTIHARAAGELAFLRQPAGAMAWELKNRRSGIAHVSGKALRRGGASHLVAHGVSRDEIAAMGRWKTQAMIEVYSDAASKEQRVVQAGRGLGPRQTHAAPLLPDAASTPSGGRVARRLSHQ